jgi:hypothetical protein
MLAHPVIATLQARSGQGYLTRRGEPQDSRLTTSLNTGVILGFRNDFYFGTNRPIYLPVCVWGLCLIMILSYRFKSINDPPLWFRVLSFGFTTFA